MTMQNFSIATFVAGLTTFLGTAAEILERHSQWSDFTATPVGMAHLLVLGAAFMALVGGALGIKLPMREAAPSVPAAPATPTTVVVPVVVPPPSAGEKA